MKQSVSCGAHALPRKRMVRDVVVVTITLLSASSFLFPRALRAQQLYPSAEAAAAAFVDAVRRQDSKALHRVLGVDWKRVMPADSVDQNDVDAFLAAWQKHHQIEAQHDGSALLSVGEAGWTLPIPIVNSDRGWHFDLRRGADQLRIRRIGRNELAAMQAVLAYVDAQREYALKDRDGNGVHEYAQKLISSPGKQDGLFWADSAGQDVSPLGPLFARSPARGSRGYHGYFYKILTAQGRHVPGGAYTYMIGGRMRSGFALIAWPVSYGNTGVMSFMVSHDGSLYEKDLGPRTEGAAQGITRFDPDPSWRKVIVSPPPRGKAT